MKISSVLFLFVAVFLTSGFVVNAQAAETIWIQSNTTAFKTNETVIVTINATSATPVQGFNAQIRYDPSCLEPENGISPITGMNGLAVPQQAGLVDVSFASTTPQMVNGVLAEVRFTALRGCQTGLNLETAALVVRNESGFAAPVGNVSIDQNPIPLSINSEMGTPQPKVSEASALSLVPTHSPASKPFHWQMVIWPALAGVLVTLILVLFRFVGPSGQ